MDKYKLKYLKYKNKYRCLNILLYAKAMSGIKTSDDKTLHLNFSFLSNQDECLCEANDWLKNKDYNMELLAPLDTSPISIIIVAIGSSSTQAYFFSENEVHSIELGSGKWYGCQNYTNKESNLEELYSCLLNAAKKHEKTDIIIHKTGSFGFKHSSTEDAKFVSIVSDIFLTEVFDEVSNATEVSGGGTDSLTDSVTYISDNDKTYMIKVPKELEYTESEMEEVRIKNSYITLLQLVRKVLENNNTNISWNVMIGKKQFKADWLDYVAERLLNKTALKTLYICDFGGGSNTLKKFTLQNGVITDTTIFKGTYNQPVVTDVVDDGEEKDPAEIIEMYQNSGMNTTIKQQIIESVEKLIEPNTIATIYIFQTGVLREWFQLCIEDEKKLFTSFGSL